MLLRFSACGAFEPGGYFALRSSPNTNFECADLKHRGNFFNDNSWLDRFTSGDISRHNRASPILEQASR
jgi:hypothetical protein